MNPIEEQYVAAKKSRSDMQEHMERLYELACECSHIVEGGVRYVVSTWAFIWGCACRGGEVHSYCWNLIPEIQKAIDICKEHNVPWFFYDGDWLQREVPETDLLMIDTNHEFWQLTAELERHGPKARKYIVMHDTTSFGEVGADGKTPGLWQAVLDFLAVNPQWEILERRTNCNGLTVLRKSTV